MPHVPRLLLIFNETDLRRIKPEKGYGLPVILLVALVPVKQGREIVSDVGCFTMPPERKSPSGPVGLSISPVIRKNESARVIAAFLRPVKGQK